MTIMFTLLVPILIGFLGLGVEASWWMQTTSAMQNVADSAASSAADASDFDGAFALAAYLGYPDGQGDIHVSAASVPCPDGQGLCLAVSIQDAVPLLFSKIFLSGDKHALAAQAVARPPIKAQVCALSFGAISGTGSFNACNTMADTTCSGGLGIGTSFAAGSNACGRAQVLTDNVLHDPYKLTLPARQCGIAPQPGTLKGTIGLNVGSPNVICGDTTLTGPVILDAAAASLVVVEGVIDLNGFSITSSSGSQVTLAFDGIKGVGTLDIAAPKSGTWSGVAVISSASALTFGSGMTLNISGLIYTPSADVTLSTTLGWATNGKQCSVIVAGSLTLTGSGGIRSNALSDCNAVGLQPPIALSSRRVLVQ